MPVTLGPTEIAHDSLGVRPGHQGLESYTDDSVTLPRSQPNGSMGNHQRSL